MESSPCLLSLLALNGVIFSFGSPAACRPSAPSVCVTFAAELHVEGSVPAIVRQEARPFEGLKHGKRHTEAKNTEDTLVKSLSDSSGTETAQSE